MKTKREVIIALAEEILRVQAKVWESILILEARYEDWGVNENQIRELRKAAMDFAEVRARFEARFKDCIEK